MPDSADLSLADVLPSAAASLGLPEFVDTCSLGRARSVTCLLVDGLGHLALEEHRPGWMDEGRASRITSVLPTTTAVALTTVGTGLLPGTHGMVGASFVLPETDEVLAPLHWGSDPTPESVQVEPTVMEILVSRGVECASVGPPEYAHSGLTRAALRGPAYRGVRDVAEYAPAVQESTRTGSAFIYAYWPELDRIGHTVGVGHPDWVAGLSRVGELVRSLHATLGPDDILVVTADHGMVECPPHRRFIWEDLPELHEGVRVVSGEPRCRLVYLDDDVDRDRIVRTWRERLEPDFAVWEGREFAASGLLGTAEEFAIDRLGDLVVVATADAMLSCPSIDPRISTLPGQHGAWTDEERFVPLVVLTGS